MALGYKWLSRARWAVFPSFKEDDSSLSNGQIPKDLRTERSLWPQAMARWGCWPRPRNTLEGPGRGQAAAEEERGVFNFVVLEKPTLYIQIYVQMPLSHLPFWAAWLPPLLSPSAHIYFNCCSVSPLPPRRPLMFICVPSPVLPCYRGLGVEMSRYDSAGPCAPSRKPLIPGCGFQPKLSPQCSVHSHKARKAPHKARKRSPRQPQHKAPSLPFSFE